MMRALDELDVRETLLERIAAGVPFLGICLGMQALFERSEEAPEVRGLGMFPGAVQRFPMDAAFRIWDGTSWRVRRESRLLAGLGERPFVYFAHSYYVPVVGSDRGYLHLRDCLIPPCSNPATYSACSSIPRNPVRLGLQIVKNISL